MNEKEPRPGLDTLADYLEGLLPEAERRDVERAVAEDPETAALLAELEGLPALLSADVAEPMPAEVAARIDASLTAERDRARPSSAATVHSLPVRRRKWLAPALVAAAAVGAIGIGAQVVDQTGVPSSSTADAEAGFDAARAEEETDALAEGAPTPDSKPERLAFVRKESFAADVTRALGSGRRIHGADFLAGSVSESAENTTSTYSIVADDCAVDLGPGRVLPILLDGDRAVLVVRRISGQRDRREALAYPARCPTTSPDQVDDLSLPIARATIVLR